MAVARGPSPTLARFVVLAGCAIAAATASGVFLVFGTIGGITVLDLLRALLVLVATFWLAGGLRLPLWGWSQHLALCQP